jgi:hypothetical protein
MICFNIIEFLRDGSPARGLETLFDFINTLISILYKNQILLDFYQ